MTECRAGIWYRVRDFVAASTVNLGERSPARLCFLGELEKLIMCPVKETDAISPSDKPGGDNDRVHKITGRVSGQLAHGAVEMTLEESRRIDAVAGNSSGAE